jgi:hypothetical protein
MIKCDFMRIQLFILYLKQKERGAGLAPQGKKEKKKER